MFIALTIFRHCLLVLLKVGLRQDSSLESEECGMMESGLRCSRGKAQHLGSTFSFVLGALYCDEMTKEFGGRRLDRNSGN
jgi:hypothetical protein